MATHKKDRPMLSVTSLLYGSPSPNSSLFNNNNNNNNVTMTSPNGLNNNGLLNNNMNNDNTSPIGCGGGGGGGISHTNQTILNSPTQIQQQLNCNSPTAMNNNNYNILTNNNNNNNNNNDCDNNNNIININNNNNNRYPPNHPLSGSKHLCAICEDRASGKHYGVYSCEGCKGFFKRTVRKDLTYVCRDDRNCIVDKRQRNRCQYCRYQKCLDMGMKREAVQEERQRNKPSTTENEPESSTNNTTPGFIHTTSLPKSANRYNYNHHHLMNNNTTNNDARIFNELNIERLTEAEKLIEINTKCSQPTINIATKEIELLFEWIRNIPYFSTLDPNDQLVLLKNGWNELLIAEFSYRSRFKQNSLLLANGMEVSQQMAQTEYIGEIFNRVLNELVAKMREMQMDSTELGCLRAIVLFNPALKNLKNPNIVEKLRECVYSLLECYCKQLYPDKTSRFAKLLVRLPALRSIGLKCIEPLFLQQYLAENNLKHDTDSFISCMLMRLK